MLAGLPYRPGNAELVALSQAAKLWMAGYNAAGTATPAERRVLLGRIMAAVGEGAVIRPPFFCDYGFNIHLGRDAFLNFNCVVLDVAAVHIGDGAQIGPAVQIYAADHPRDAAGRRAGLELGRRCGSAPMRGSAAVRSSCRV